MPWWSVALAFFIGLYGGMILMGWFLRSVRMEE